ncbi:TMV resistance protein N-like protein [Tanacetum coccineum]
MDFFGNLSDAAEAVACEAVEAVEAVANEVADAAEAVANEAEEAAEAVADEAAEAVEEAAREVDAAALELEAAACDAVEAVESEADALLPGRGIRGGRHSGKHGGGSVMRELKAKLHYVGMIPCISYVTLCVIRYIIPTFSTMGFNRLNDRQNDPVQMTSSGYAAKLARKKATMSLPSNNKHGRGGGQLGGELLVSHHTLFNKNQVFDSSEKAPDKVLHQLFVNLEKLNHDGDSLDSEIQNKLEDYIIDCFWWETITNYSFEHVYADLDPEYIGILGMGEIGKTTIAPVLFRRISYKFMGSSFVKDVRENSSTPKDIEGSIVLDDVDDFKQLEFLAESNEWCGSGSRITIITRNEQLLSDANSKYKPPLLTKDQALEQFSRHTFQENSHPEGYIDVSNCVIRYTGCLPLALKVLGYFFHGRQASVSESALDRLAKIPIDKGIFDSLKLSFDNLNGFE